MNYNFLVQNAKKSYDLVSSMKENISLLLSMKDDIQTLKNQVPAVQNTNDDDAWKIAQLTMQLLELFPNEYKTYFEAINSAKYILDASKQAASGKVFTKEDK